MSENNRNIDELFRQELGNATEAPPSSVWEILEQRLEQEPVTRKSGRKPYLPYLLLLLVAALIVGYFIVHNRAEKNREPIQKETGAAHGGKTTDLSNSLQTDTVADRHQKQQEALAAAENTTTDYPRHGQGSATTGNTSDKGITWNGPASSRSISEHSDAAQVHTLSEKKSPLNRKSKYSTTGKQRAGGVQNAGRKTSLSGNDNIQDAEKIALSGTTPVRASTTTTKQASRRNTGKIATAKESSAAQKQQTPSPDHTPSIEREENKLPVKTNPKQEVLTANNKKTGRQVRPGNRDNARMSNELPVSTTQSANTGRSGTKQTGSKTSSVPAGPNTLTGKAGNETQAIETAQSTPSVKSEKAATAKSSNSAAAQKQDKVADNRKPATLAEASGSVPPMSTTGKEATAKNGTRVTDSSAKTEQRKGLKKAANDREPATLATARGPVQPKAMLKAGKETAAKSSIRRSDSTVNPEQGKVQGKAATLTAASGTAQPKAMLKAGKETVIKSDTRRSESTVDPKQGKVQGKAATLTAASGTVQPKSIPKAGKETVIKGDTRRSESTVNPEQGKATPSTAAAETVQSKAIPKAEKGTAAQTGTRMSDSSTNPEQRKGLEKVLSTREAATLAADTEQPKAIAKTKKETEIKSSSDHGDSAAAQEQEKAREKAANTANNRKTATTAAPSSTTKPETTTPVKAGKETVAKSSTYSNGSSAGRKQDKTLEKTGNNRKTEGNLSTASTAMRKATLSSASGTQLTKEEKKPLVSKNEADEDSGNDEPAEGSGGQSGGASVPAAAKNRNKRPLNMSIGVKAAYEKGFQSYTANTMIASVFGEVNFSPKISFIIQPGIKLANTSKEYRTANGTYIRAGDVKSNMYYEERDSMRFPTGYKNYAYSQTYDSIVAYRQAQKKFTEFELPFMVRYRMDKNLSFLAGMNFTFGKTLKMEGVLQTYGNLSLADTIFHHYDTAGITPPAPGVFTHPGSVLFSSYKDPGATALINLIRFGYTFGLSYTAKERLIIDLTLQQNLSRLSDIDDEQIKKLFTQPYIRVSVGYSILGRRK